MDLGFLGNTDAILWRAYDASVNRAMSAQNAARTRQSGTGAQKAAGAMEKSGAAAGKTEGAAEETKGTAAGTGAQQKQEFDNYLKGYLDGISGARSIGTAGFYGLGSYGSFGGFGGIGAFGGWGYNSLANTLLGASGASYGNVFQSVAQSGRAGAKAAAAVNNPNMEKLNSFTNNRVTGYSGFQRTSPLMDQLMSFPNNGFTR